MFVNKWRNSTGTLTNDDRGMFRRISQELNDALQPSADENKPIPPQDLRTVASFVQAVARWVLYVVARAQIKQELFYIVPSLLQSWWE